MNPLTGARVSEMVADLDRIADTTDGFSMSDQTRKALRDGANALSWLSRQCDFRETFYSTHRLADGAPLVLGMRVRDYDRKYGVIAETLRNEQELAKVHQQRTSSGMKPIPPGEEAKYTCDSWFDVKCDDGSTSLMDCSRMIAEGGRLDR